MGALLRALTGLPPPVGRRQLCVRTPHLPPSRNIAGRLSPRLIWLAYFCLWGVLLVAENLGKHALR